MGCYTNLWFSAKLNERGLAIVNQLADLFTKREAMTYEERCEYHKTDSPRWKEIALTNPEFANYAQLERADQIPAECIHIKDGVWHVDVNFKDYGGEIRTFIAEVLPYLIAEPCTAEWLGDFYDDDEPTIELVQPK